MFDFSLYQNQNQNQAAHVIKRLMLYLFIYLFPIQFAKCQLSDVMSSLPYYNGLKAWAWYSQRRDTFTHRGSERPEQVLSLKIFLFVYLFVCVWDTCVLWFFFFGFLFLSPGYSNRQPSLKYQPITIQLELISTLELLGGPCLACKSPGPTQRI